MSEPQKMPPERASYTRRFCIRYIDEVTGERCELKFYVTAGAYADGRLGEIFVRGDKVGGFISGALDALAMTMSVGLQHGVPLEILVEKLRHNRFGPSGFTGDSEFPSCTSMFDLIAQWLWKKFPNGKLIEPEPYVPPPEPKFKAGDYVRIYKGGDPWHGQFGKVMAYGSGGGRFRVGFEHVGNVPRSAADYAENELELVPPDPSG